MDEKTKYYIRLGLVVIVGLILARLYSDVNFSGKSGMVQVAVFIGVCVAYAVVIGGVIGALRRSRRK
jgi:hypothetical protein